MSLVPRTGQFSFPDRLNKPGKIKSTRKEVMTVALNLCSNFALKRPDLFEIKRVP